MEDFNKKSNGKTISSNSFLVDINMVEVPMFIFKPKKSVKNAEYWLNSNDLSEIAKKVLKRKSDGKNILAEYMKWTDSRGNEREILATSQESLPNGFAMDVLFTLIALYIKKSPSIVYCEEECKYILPTRKVSCSLTELCEYMGISDGGKSIDKIKNAIYQLEAVHYYPITTGIIYNGQFEEFEEGESSIRLLEYEILARKQQRTRDKHSVTITFGDIILSNIEKSFIKFLNNDTYFSLRSGLTRRLYTYLEGNKYNKSHIVRKYDTLKYKLPVDFRSKSDLKRKLKAPLERLREVGAISDYMYADEFNIPVEEKECIYFIFKGTKNTIIKQLEEDYAKKHPKLKSSKEKLKVALEIETELVFPNDIRQELVDIGINSKKITEIMSKYGKYKIAEYILWLKDGVARGKAKDPAGMFVFAITDEMVKVKKTHPHIIEFVARYKAEVEGKQLFSEETIKEAYSDYIDREISLFEEDDEFMFEATKESILDDIEEVQEKRIKSQRQLYNMATKKDEKAKMLSIIEKWEKFSTEREKSEIFIEQFVKKTKIYRSLKDYNEFKQEFISKNS